MKRYFTVIKISTYNPQIKNISFKQNSNFFDERLKKLKEMGTKDFDTNYFSDNFDKLTKEEQEILLEYGTENYRQFNETLRGNLDNDFAKRKISQLDNIIKKAKPLNKEKIVYRAIDENLAKQYITDLCAGKIVEDKAFLSTGAILDYQGEFKYFANKENSFILRIHLPKGTKGACLPIPEFILPRDSKLKLINLDKKLKIADVEYILPSENEVKQSTKSGLLKYGIFTGLTALGVYGLYMLNKKSDKGTKTSSKG